MFLTIPTSQATLSAFLANLAAISEALDYHTVFEEPPNFFEVFLEPANLSINPAPTKPLTPPKTTIETPESFNNLPSLAEPSIMTRFLKTRHFRGLLFLTLSALC